MRDLPRPLVDPEGPCPKPHQLIQDEPSADTTSPSQFLCPHTIPRPCSSHSERVGNWAQGGRTPVRSLGCVLKALRQRKCEEPNPREVISIARCVWGIFPLWFILQSSRESLLGSQSITQEQRQAQLWGHHAPGFFQRNSIQAFLHRGKGAQVEIPRSPCLALLPGTQHCPGRTFPEEIQLESALGSNSSLGNQGFGVLCASPTFLLPGHRCHAVMSLWWNTGWRTPPAAGATQLCPADCQDQEAGWRQPSCGKISPNGAVFTGDILCF